MMKCYLGTKIIQAEPMILGDFRKGKWEKDNDGHFSLSVKLLIEDPETPGYLVKHNDFYTSWCPKDEFEDKNRLITPDKAKLIVGDGAVFVVDQNKDRRELLAKGLESEGENHDKNA